MKKVLLLAVMAMFSISYLYSQTTDSIQSKKSYAYCELVGTKGVFSTKVKVEVDFGQAVSFFNQDRRLKDENGNSIQFNSMIDALNSMGSKGWVFVQAYAITMGNTNVYHYLLKKETSKEDLDKIINTKD